jgi:hypothetical protein
MKEGCAITVMSDKESRCRGSDSFARLIDHLDHPVHDRF